MFAKKKKRNVLLKQIRNTISAYLAAPCVRFSGIKKKQNEEKKKAALATKEITLFLSKPNITKLHLDKRNYRQLCKSRISGPFLSA